MRPSKLPILLAVAFFIVPLLIHAQTVIYSNPGASYNNTDAATNDNYGPVDVSNCSSISFSIQYNFSLPYPGSGNMESSDECPFGSGCAGDPSDPSGGACANCWDFFYVQFQIGGVTVQTELVGVPGSTNQSGTFTYGPVCTNGATDAGLIVQTQTWAANETITFSNITITCWDASATLMANPDPVCSGLPFDLSSTLTDPSSVASTLWTGPGTIATPTNLSTNVTGAPLGTNTYTFTATDDNACTNSSTIDVTVNQGPTLDDPPNITVCADEPVNVAFTGTVNPTVSWTNSNVAIGLGANGMGDLSFTAASVAAPTTGTITITPMENGCTGPSQNFTITVNPTPTVMDEPDLEVCAGASVTTGFSGTPGATFSWTNDNLNIGLGASGFVVGAGTFSFTAANVSSQEVANIEVTPSLNGCPGLPITYTITVNPAPTVVDPPNQAVCAGDPVDVIFSGTVNPTFNWTNNNPAIGLGASGMGDISFTAANVVVATTGTITVTPNEAGCPGPAQTFTITVNPIPSVNQPNDVSVCAGAPVIANFTGTAGATYNWTNDNPAIGLGAAGSGNLNFISANVAGVEVGTITLTPTLNGCPGAPISFTITVNPVPTVVDPPNQAVCAGEPVDVIFSGSVNPTFNWTNNNPAIGLGANGTGDISFTAANVVVSTTGTITVTPNEAGCPGPAQTFTITVTPIPSVNQPNDLSVCAGAPVVANFTGTPGATFSWTNDNPAIGLGAAGSGNLNFISANVAAVEVGTITLTPTISGCPGNPVSFTITVNPTPTVTDPADQTVCPGDPVEVIFSGTGTFNWTNSNVGIGLGPNGSGDINFTAANVVNTTTGTITVTPTLAGCPGPAQSFSITVNPVPSVNQPNDVIVCAGEPVVANFTGSAGATFDWVNDNPAIGLAASGSGNLNFTSANVLVQEVATITITPINNGCPGISLTFTITVNPVPMVDDPMNQTVCSGELVEVLFSGTVNPTFSWTNNNPLIGLGLSGTGDISFTAANVVVPTTGSITVTATEAGCPGPTQDFTITVNPIPSVNQPGDVIVCSGNQVVTNFTGSPGATFSWTNDNPAIGLGASGTGNLNFPSANVAAQEVANIMVTPTLNGCPGNPLSFTITVNPLPSVADPADQTVCPGDPVDVIFSGTGTFDWTNSNPAIGLGANGSGDINFTAANVANTTTGTITVTPTLAGCPGPAQSFTITVNPIPSVNQPGDVTVCSGAPVVANFTGSPGATFDWVNNNPAIGLGASGSGSLNFVTANVVGQEVANITVTPSINGCLGSPLNFLITVNPIPTVAGPPNQAVCAGEPVDVIFSGTVNPTFIWTNSNPAIGLAANGTGDISFTAANVAATTTGTITVTPTEAGCPGPAQTFTITVNPIPNVNQPADVTVCSGAAVVANFTGSPGAVFGWSNDNPAIGLGASGSGNLNFTSANVAVVEVGTITVTPSNGCLGAPLTFTITVNPTPTVIDQPNQTICSGSQVTATFSGTNNPVFNWTNNNTSIGLAASGSGNISFVAGNAGLGTITVTPTENGCVGIPQTFDITVLGLPVVDPALDVNSCAGTAVAVNFTGTAGAIYSWTNSETAIGLAASGTGNISFSAANVGATTAGNIIVSPSLNGCIGTSQSFNITIDPLPTITINAVSCASDLLSYSIDLNSSGTTITSTAGNVMGSGGNFTISGIPAGTNVTITSTITATGCQSQQSVNAPNCNCPPVSAATGPNSPVICEGAPTPTLSVSTAPGSTVDWFATASGGVPLLIGNTSYTPPGMLTPGVYSFFAEARDVSSNCTSATRLEVTLTVNAVPSVIQPLDQNVCAGTQISIPFSGTASAAMNWSNSNVNIGLGANGTGDISFLTTNPGSTPLVSNLVVTPSLNGCTGTAQNFTITVNPIPTLTAPTNLTQCGGTSIAINFSGTGGATLDWTNSNPAIGLGATGTGNINFIAANVTTPTLANISVTPSLAGCTGLTQNFSITINPVPSVNAPSSQNVCVDSGVALNFTGTSGAIFSWTNSNANIGLGASGMGDINFISTNAGSTPLVGNLVVTPSQNGCTGTAQNFTITVNPLPSLTVDSTECSVDLTNYSIFVNSNANTLIASVGTVSGTAPNFVITNIPIASNAVLTVTNTVTSCSQQQTVNAPNCNCLPVSPATLPNNPSICEGAANPALTVTIAAGNTVDWYAAPTGGSPLLMGSTSFTPTGTLAPGVYSFYAEVRETASNCTSATRLEVTLTVNALPTVMPPANQAVCAGTLLAVNFTGSVSATLNWTNSNPSIGLPASGTGNISFLATNSGNAPVVANLVVTPSLNGCTGAAQNFVLTVNPIPGLVLDSINCSSDLSSYTIYVSSNANTLTASVGTVTNSGNAFSITGIPDGTNALLTVTNTATGCTQQQTVNAPNCNCLPVNAATQPNNPSICEGAPNPALTVSTLSGNTVDWYATPSGGTPVLAGNTSYTPAGILTPGVYRFYAEAREISSSCTSTTRLEVTLTVLPNPVAAIAGNTSICNGDPTTLTASGGSSFSWSSGESTAVISIQPSSTSTYTITVLENGCAATATTTVTVLQPTASTVNVISCDPAQMGTTTTILPNAAGCDSILTTITTLDIDCIPAPVLSNGTVTCFGNTDGILMLSVTSGPAPFQYNWSNGFQSGSGLIPNTGSPIQIQNLAAGTYTVTITGSNGLTSTLSAVVNAPPVLTAQATAQLVFGQYALSCNGATDASINAAANGGTPQYQYTWNLAGQNSPLLTGVGAGIYQLTVTDANQCTVTSSVAIQDPPALGFDIALANVVCGENSTSAQINPVNGAEPFSVYIDGAFTAEGLMPTIPTGDHLIEIQDANGCTADTMLSIGFLDVPLITLPSEVSVSPGETLILEAQTNLSNWQSLVWTPTPDTSCAQCLRQEWIPTNSGIYEVVITNQAGCSASASVRVLVKNRVDIYIPNVFSPNGDGENDLWTVHGGASVLTLNSLQIFDRWGDMVYSLQDPLPINAWPGWDGVFRGDPVNPGVFVYYLEVKLTNGEVVLKKGDVTVVR